MSNTVELIGALVDEVELRYTPSGTAVCELTLAGKSNAAWYHRVTAWGKLAEAAATLTVGTVVHVAGRLEHQTWEKDGQKRSTVKIVADALGITDGTVGADQRGQPMLENALNHVLLAGNLVRDPESRAAGSGTVTNATIAVNEKWNGEDRAHFIDIALWDAEFPGHKGDKVIVTGEWRTRSYEKDGQKVYRSEVNASFVTTLESRSGTSERGTPSPSNARLDIDDEFPAEDSLPF